MGRDAVRLLNPNDVRAFPALDRVGGVVLQAREPEGRAGQLAANLIPQDVELSGWLKVLDSGWINLIAFGIVAVILVIVSRGRLGYQPDPLK